jgi:thioredoxin-related protein
MAQEIRWMTWEEAVTANAKKPKKIFVDVYTEWCGWCKRMDATTFKDPAVIALMNEKFYAVKLDAEQKESIFWRETEFKWMAGGRGGVNRLAYDLLDGKLSFPSFVMMDSNFDRIAISPGYKEGPAMLKELRFAAEEIYKTSTWQQYQSSGK